MLYSKESVGTAKPILLTTLDQVEIRLNTMLIKDKEVATSHYYLEPAFD
jgi:hypothetical protein